VRVYTRGGPRAGPMRAGSNPLGARVGSSPLGQGRRSGVTSTRIQPNHLNPGIFSRRVRRASPIVKKNARECAGEYVNYSKYTVRKAYNCRTHLCTRVHKLRKGQHKLHFGPRAIRARDPRARYFSREIAI
jgi:hypothetical protein